MGPSLRALIRLRGILPALVCGLWVAACSLPFARPPTEPVPPLRISEVAESGDPARRASLRLVLAGLEADESRQPQRALGRYEEALRVDPTNPYAYLAIARHHAEGEDPEWALSFLDKADALLRAEGLVDERVEPHLIGLRGQVLYTSGQLAAGLPYLERAWESAPVVWSDGRLSAAELY